MLGFRDAGMLGFRDKKKGGGRDEWDMSFRMARGGGFFV